MKGKTTGRQKLIDFIYALGHWRRRFVSLPWDCSSGWSDRWNQSKGGDAGREPRTPTGSSLWSCDPQTHPHIYDSAKKNAKKYKFVRSLHSLKIGINAVSCGSNKTPDVLTNVEIYPPPVRKLWQSGLLSTCTAARCGSAWRSPPPGGPRTHPRWANHPHRGRMTRLWNTQKCTHEHKDREHFVFIFCVLKMP